VQGRPFKRLTVESHFNLITNQSILVAWVLNEDFVEPGPYTFRLQRGRAVTDDEWDDISQTVDQPWLYDNHPVLEQHDRSTMYRVIMTDGNKVEYASQPVSIFQDWSHYDWRLMKEIVRKELLIQTRKAGATGYLLKRRWWGEPCTTCVDPNTDGITNSHCPQCFGTGITGGYYPPFLYYMTMEPSQRMKRLTPDQGVIAAIVETGRALAWPTPEGDDIWVQAEPNKRFRVMPDVQAIARHRGVDLILNLRLVELPLEDIVYSVPTPTPVTCTNPYDIR
jgi:hypothetical protein